MIPIEGVYFCWKLFKGNMSTDSETSSTPETPTPKKKLFFLSRGFLIGLTAAILLFFTVFAFYGYQILYAPNLQVNKEKTIIYLPTGANFQTVLDTLGKYQIINDKVSFAFLSKLMKYQELVKPGRYEIEKDMSNLDAVRMLRNGLQMPLKVVINPVRLKENLVEKISPYFEMQAEELQQSLEDSSLHKEFGFSSETILCLFLPNTYDFYWNTSAEELMRKMHKEYQKFWNEERLAKAKQLELSPVEVSILASIVEAETQKNDEKRRMAGVYVNRLKQGNPLQADPTVVYAVGDFTLKRVLNKHLKVDSPYNTYKHKGLPPGPINLPSIASIDAVLNYEKHEYFFFCAKEDFSGYHSFAVTNAEHEANARRYRQALNERGIK